MYLILNFKESEFSDDQDWDGDGIKNVDEVRHGTNLQSEEIGRAHV